VRLTILNTVRTVVERVSRGVVLKRRLPVRYGRNQILASPDSAIKFWKHNLEQLTRGSSICVINTFSQVVVPGTLGET
jgi:hypothetical protein